ncbi:hypothetical protein I352_04405, partial [Cryptococcus deuterogattii MMRL2647]
IGGNEFDVVARRLSQEEHDALTTLMITRLSPFFKGVASLTIHLTHFVFRHTAYFGIQPIDITLTDDPEVFCNWFGIDYQKWLIQGKSWKLDWQFWQWSTEAPNESPAGTAFRRLARKIQRDGDKAMKKAKGKRDSFADKIYVWFMSRSKWAPTEEDENASTTPDEEKERGELPPKSTPAELSMINIDKPLPMDKGAEEVLDFWGKRAEYDALFEQRKIVARPLQRARG